MLGRERQIPTAPTPEEQYSIQSKALHVPQPPQSVLDLRFDKVAKCCALNAQSTVRGKLWSEETRWHPEGHDDGETLHARSEWTGIWAGGMSKQPGEVVAMSVVCEGK